MMWFVFAYFAIGVLSGGLLGAAALRLDKDNGVFYTLAIGTLFLWPLVHLLLAVALIAMLFAGRDAIKEREF